MKIHTLLLFCLLCFFQHCYSNETIGQNEVLLSTQRLQVFRALYIENLPKSDIIVWSPDGKKIAWITYHIPILKENYWEALIVDISKEKIIERWDGRKNFPNWAQNFDTEEEYSRLFLDYSYSFVNNITIFVDSEGIISWCEGDSSAIKKGKSYRLYMWGEDYKYSGLNILYSQPEWSINPKSWYYFDELRHPVWSPDGKKIAFIKVKSGILHDSYSLIICYININLKEKANIFSPDLVFEISTLDGDNTVVGGKEEGIRVVVKNTGKGIAKWVRVALEGDNTLLKYWGTERNLEDIKPGRSKSAEFSLLMPTDLPRKTAAIKVSIKEGRGYSPTTVKTLTLNLVPAEKRIEKAELVQDVDYDIPNGKISRKNGYALIIGLSKYSNATPPKYSRNDAEVFSKYVSKVLGIKPSHIKTIYDDKATCSIIKANLTDWMKRKRGFKVIYFAGHGVPDPENPREGDVYLLPYDGDPELKSTLISLRDIAEIGANAGDTVLLVLDACFSGSEGRTVQLASRPLGVAKIPETNAITFAASEGNQPSKEYGKARHGYFTYYLLLGLKGKADINRDGWITTEELYSYVSERVSDATNNVQVPVLRPMRDIKIGRVK